MVEGVPEIGGGYSGGVRDGDGYGGSYGEIKFYDRDGSTCPVSLEEGSLAHTAAFREGCMVVKSMWQVVVLINKGGGDYGDIIQLDVVW